MNIEGQAALVSGGASGLGARTARRLARLATSISISIVENPALDGEAVHLDGTPHMARH